MHWVEEIARDPQNEPGAKCALTAALFQVCLAAKMSFRLFSLNICRAGLAGVVCLACTGALRAGDKGPQNVEVVPLRGDAAETNVDQFQPAGTKDFKAMTPLVPHPFRFGTPAQGGTLPPPQPQVVLPSQRDQELLDRRRNWVFMTPEDMAGSAAEKSLNGYEKDGEEKKSVTVMQRYYQHLYDSDRQAATNQVGRIDADSWTRMTNSVGGDGMRSVDSPFNTTPDSGIFQPARANSFSSLFGSDNSATGQSQEDVRLQAEQQAHIENFKQLWNIDQPAATPVSASLPAAPNSTPLFGSSQNDQRAFHAVTLPANGFSLQQNPTPVQPTVTSVRNASQPPRSTYAPSARPF